MLRLIVTNGHFEGVSVEVHDSLAIGRAQDSGLFIPDPQVSRRHTKVFLEGDRYWVVDDGSHNGTFLNEVRVDGKRALRSGDVIRLGNTSIAVELRGLVTPTGRLKMEEESDEVTLTLERPVVDLAPPSLEAISSDSNIEGFNFPTVADLRSANDRSLAMILANAKRFAILFHVARSLQESTETERLLANMLDKVFKVLDADRGDIVLIHPETGETRPVLSMNRKGNLLDTVRISRTVMRRVLNSRMAVISTDAPNDPRLGSSDSIIMYGMRSIMCVPMVFKEKVVGLIQIVNEKDFAAFSEDDLYLLTVFAALAAVAVENARLYEHQKRVIAELRQAHENLVKAQQELVMQERLATVGQMSAGIAHEIRNSLGPISLVHLLKERFPEDTTVREYSDLILEAHSRILTIVEELRNYTSGNTKSSPAEPVCGSLEELLRSSMRFLKFDRDVKRFTLDLVIESSPVAVYHPERLKQVVINLVRNGAQAISKPSGRVVVRLQTVGSEAVVRVEDTGDGIDPSVQARIWEPFFTTKPGTGMGLGLDISKMIVEQHGGRIECTSVPGQGTVMSVFLPLATATPVTRTQPVGVVE